MSKIESIKQHVKKYKAVYITGGVCLAVGATGGVAYAIRRPEIIQNAQLQNILCWRPESHQHVIQFIERSTPSKPIHLKGTQQYFDSIHAAARQTGHSVSDISKNVNGLRPDVKGDVFELVDVAS